MEKCPKIPNGVASVLQKIEAVGEEAYLVGGCVRDWYMSCQPHDYDITTSALPEKLLKIFQGSRVIETGLQHGTVTVLTLDGPVEVTTYRQDGAYSDHRHPDAVTFTRSLSEDLARRDYTMNAMAMDRAGTIIDPFGGSADIDVRVIRCVGEPDRRFREDALRIFRGLRFAARLGFQLEKETAAAMERKKDLLHKIASERIFSELCGLLEGAYAAEILADYGGILAEVLPELNFKDIPYLKTLPPVSTLRLAALLPEGGADTVLLRLKVSNAFRQEVLLLVRERGEVCPPERVAVRRRCVALGAENFIKLCQFQKNEKAKRLAEELLQEGACLSVKELAVSGKDLMALGLKGARIGETLMLLLEQVTEEQVPNEKEPLLKSLKK